MLGVMSNSLKVSACQSPRSSRREKPVLCVRGLCLPAHLDVLMTWAEEERISPLAVKISVWSREEDTDSTAMPVLCATGSKQGCVPISLRRGVPGKDGGQKPQRAGGAEDALVGDKSTRELEVWKTLLSQLPVP